MSALAQSNRAASVGAAALLMQTLLVSARGRVVPTRLISDVQVRALHIARDTAAPADVEESELSRRRLRASPTSSGFRHFAMSAPAFLPFAGND